MVYEFGSATYQHIYNDLSHKDLQRYTKNGILWMLQRDMKVKQLPERFHHEMNQKFDLIISYELRVYDSVYSELCNRHDNNIYNNYSSNTTNTTIKYCYLINIETIDNHSEALNSSHLTLQLIQLVYQANDWHNNITSIIDTFQQQNNKQVMYTIVPY